MRILITGIDNGGHPVRGVIHAAMQLDDAPLAEQSSQRFAAVLAPKLRGGQILDQLTRNHDLDFFVLYSSILGLVGNRSQVGYLAGNLSLEALARSRRRAGQHALAVGWAVIDDVGYVAREGLQPAMERLGLGLFGSAQAMAALDDMLTGDDPVVTASNPDWERVADLFPLLKKARFSHVVPERQANREPVPKLSRDALAQAEPETAMKIVADALIALLADILQTRPERVTTDRLDRLGVDSLIATDIVVAIRRRFSCDLPAMEIVSATVPDLTRRLLVQLRPAAAVQR